MHAACNQARDPRGATQREGSPDVRHNTHHMSQSLIKSLVVQGQTVALAELVGARHFIADKFGVTIPKVAKGEKGLTMKEVKALCVAKGTTADELKAASKEYDGLRTGFYTRCALVNGQLAADPTLRKSVRLSTNKKGETIGAVTTYRRERSASVTQAARIVQLEAKIAQLTAASLALPAA